MTPVKAILPKLRTVVSALVPFMRFCGSTAGRTWSFLEGTAEVVKDRLVVRRLAQQSSCYLAQPVDVLVGKHEARRQVHEDGRSSGSEIESKVTSITRKVTLGMLASASSSLAPARRARATNSSRRQAVISARSFMVSTVSNE